MRSMRAMMACSSSCSGSNPMVSFSLARFTFARLTPGSLRTLRSMVVAQFAQVMPVTGIVTFLNSDIDHLEAFSGSSALTPRPPLPKSGEGESLLFLSAPPLLESGEGAGGVRAVLDHNYLV